MKRILALTLSAFSILLLVSCKSLPKNNIISKELNIDLSAGEVTKKTDTHGGFLGDGTTCIVLKFPDGKLGDIMKGDSSWDRFPLSDTVNTLVYMTTDSISENIPDIENGYYKLIDRHEDQSKPILERYSYNFTVALYDCDENTFYYFKFDT